MSAALALDPAADLAVHRGAMLRFARRKIRDEALAEDTVQDALLAALSARHSFQGQSAVRTWLIGILNHKIQDAFRRETRYVKLDAHADDAAEGEDRLERAASAQPSTADDDDPLQEVARRRMHAALVDEVERLPEGLKSVFMMQAIEGVATPRSARSSTSPKRTSGCGCTAHASASPSGSKTTSCRPDAACGSPPAPAQQRRAAHRHPRSPHPHPLRPPWAAVEDVEDFLDIDGCLLHART